MATFPALTPNARSLSYGDYPQGTYEAISGSNVRFRYGSDRVVQRLSLNYRFITEAEMQLLLDHYEGQQGSLIPFVLSTTIGLLNCRRTTSVSPDSIFLGSPLMVRIRFSDFQ